MPRKFSQVLFTVPEFAFLVHRQVETIRQMLRDGKLKGIQAHKGCLWRVPESELAKFWGLMYGKPRTVRRTAGEGNGSRH